MILKKEEITNGKIECYVPKDGNFIKIKAGAQSFNIKLKNIKYIENSTKLDEITNYLLKINKALSELKSKNGFITNSDITVIVNEEEVLKVVKPNGIIPAKPSNTLKKSISNVDFKRTLGILLYKFSTFEKIDLIFEEFLLKEKEDGNMNNNFKNKKEDINFELDSQNDNFDLDMDISSFNDIINVSEDSSFNYEDELFKDFDLNTDDLFKETTENDDFILDFYDENLDNSSKATSNEISEKSIYTTSENISEVNESFNFDLSLNSENHIREKDFKLSSNNSFTDNTSILNTDEILINDEFKIKDDFISTKDKSEEDFNIPVYEPKEDFTIPVYESKEENFLVIEESNDVISDEYMNIKTEDIKDNTENIKSEEIIISNQIKTELPKEILVDANIDNITSDKDNYVQSKEKHNSNNSKKENPKNNYISRNDSKTSVIKKDKAEAKFNNKEKNSKERNIMENNISNSCSKINNKDFIKKEMIELRDILKNKSNSYKSKIDNLNVEFEAKHLVLKDLNLRDEEEQLEVFKEFLKCKSNMLDLHDLNETCNSIIVDIDNKISNL